MASPDRSGLRVRLALVCVGLATTLLWLPPGPLPYVVFAADLPFLLLLFHRGGLRWKRWAWLYGTLHFALALRWLHHVHPLEVPVAALVLGPTYVLFGAAIRWAARVRAPFVAAVGVAAVGEEWLRTIWLGGMPWPMRSLAFAGENGPLGGLDVFVPAAGLCGAYAFSFVAASCSALLFGFLRRAGMRDAMARRAARAPLALGALVPLVALFVLGTYAVSRTRGYETRVAAGELLEVSGDWLAIQASIEQSLKNEGLPHSMQEIFERHVAISKIALAREPKATALLWPETMVPWSWLAPGVEARFPPAWRDEVAVSRRLRSDVLQERDLDVFLGVLSRHPAADGRPRERLDDLPERDSVVHLRPRRGPAIGDPLPRPPPDAAAALPTFAAGPFPARHDKVQLVPGGESMPLGDWFPFLHRLREMVSSIPLLEPGADEQTPFVVSAGPPWREGSKPPGHGEIRVGTAICFDLAFPRRTRTWKRMGAGVLLNPANYAWFGESDFRAQVRALGRLRAAEAGLALVMAGNSGPTAFFDALGREHGRFVETSEEGAAATPPTTGSGRADTTWRRGYAIGRPRADAHVPPTVWLGDLPWLAFGIALLGVGYHRRARFGRRREALRALPAAESAPRQP